MKLVATILVAALFGGLSTQISGAAEEMQPPPGMRYTIMKRVDVTGANGLEALLGTVEVQPGTTIPRHFHNGEEVAYVLEGAMVDVPGKGPQMFETGTSIHNAREVVHGGLKVLGEKPLKFITVHIVDKGKPIYVEAK